MNGAAEQRFFEFLGEKALLQGSREAQIETFVSSGLDNFSLDTQPRMSRVELFDNDLSLCERQVAATRAKDDMFFGLQEISNARARSWPRMSSSAGR